MTAAEAEVVDNPSPVDAALVLMNPSAALTIPKGKGIKGYTAMAIPMLKYGATIGVGYIAGNGIRDYVSKPIARAIFGKDKVTPNQALIADWVMQLLAAGIAIQAGRAMKVPDLGIIFGAGIIANTALATSRQTFLKPKPGKMDWTQTLTFVPTGPSAPPQAGLPGVGQIMAPQDATGLMGIMPMPAYS